MIARRAGPGDRRSLRANVLAVMAVSALAAGAVAQGLAGELRTIDGRTLRGVLTVAADGAATLRDGDTTTVLQLAELVSFAPDGAQRAVVAAPHRVWLRSGLELPALALRGRAAADGRPPLLVAELPCGVAAELPLGFVRALRHGGSERREPPRFAIDFADPPDNEDVLFVQRDGQSHRSQVTVTGLTEERIDFLLRGKAYDFPLVATAGVVFGRNTGFAPDRQERPRAALSLVTGERLEGRLLALDADVRLRLDEGAELALPRTSLHRLEIRSDRLVRLSELVPQAEQTPAFDRVWPWTNDGTPGGDGFVIAETTFDHGVGMVPRTRLTYDLGGRFDVFEAMVGIDDRGGPAAHAVFRVLIDGAVAWQSQPKTLGEPATPVRVDVAGCRQLAIECDFGENYDLGDFCAWADARVVQR